MNKFLAISAVALSMASFQPALAGNHGHGDDDRPKLTKEEHEARKAAWEAMSKEEKIAEIEKKRAEKRAKSDEKWSSMTDDEKIAFVEEKRESRKDRKKDRKKDRD